MKKIIAYIATPLFAYLAYRGVRKGVVTVGDVRNARQLAK